ncbi:MAG TPA: winged helix DNA-binding protein [Sphingomonas sp.]|nr:winged helix DNA-binding protein [Sphingomonas sp.]
MTSQTAPWGTAADAGGLAGLADRPFNALAIADPGAAGDEGAAAVGHAGGRLIARIGWADAAGTLGDHALVDLLMIEAEGVGEDRLDAVLPRVDTLARATEAQVVVALDTAQIDRIAAHLFGPRVQLLCAPTRTDRVAALSVARLGSMRLRESMREAESERLRRLNEEVARIAQTLARLTDREDLLPSAERRDLLGDRRGGYGAPPAGSPRPVDAQEVRRAIRSRRMREQFFPAGLLEDPGWDMLLDLFAAELEDRAVSVSSLCIAAAVAPTTALRWIAKMTEAGLFERHPDPFDRRRAFMRLSDAAREGLRRYCHAAGEAGLSIA